VNVERLTRILFVDDEPRVLDGLRRTLHAQRGRWSMTFAVGGAAALVELERAAAAGVAFDVVVSDMRMPEVDGLKLLTTARERWPRTVRVVLSGYMDMEVALRSTTVAHQFLAKPCDPAELEAVVERTCGLATLLGDEALRAAVGEVGALASRPTVYAELDRALDDPRAGLAEMSAIIEREISLTAKVLQVVNSSYFGLPRSVTTVAHAVAHLGANVVRALVLSHEIAERAGAGARALPAGFPLGAHQAHALRVASLARAVAGGGAAADDAFLAGVLHDVGKLVLAAQRPTWLPNATALADARGLPVHEAEAALFGVSHAEVGAYLVGLWGLPFRIVEAVAQHHAPSRVGRRPTLDAVAAVHVANALVAEADGAPDALDRAFVESLGIAARLDGWRAAAGAEAA
jgi:putative nucleotidyltransferase with HDIG domain